MKILLIEDSLVQIDWAKESLGEHQLTVVETVRDAEEILEKERFEIIISDLELPEEKGQQPNFKNGEKLFLEKLLPIKKKGELKGLALISNFEHHLFYKSVHRDLKCRPDNYMLSLGMSSYPNESQPMEMVREIKNKISKEVEVAEICLRKIEYIGTNFFKFKSRGENVVVVIDHNISQYPNYHHPIYGAIKNKELKEVVKVDDSIGWNIFICACTKEGVIPLKPYTEVVDVLK